MPDELKKIITTKLSSYIENYTYSNTIKNRLQQMINLMNDKDKDDIKLFKDFKIYMKQLDGLRKHNFVEIFPMWDGYYD